MTDETDAEILTLLHRIDARVDRILEWLDRMERQAVEAVYGEDRMPAPAPAN